MDADVIQITALYTIITDLHLREQVNEAFQAHYCK